ncbi:MAG: DUF86 domain-containing protein [Elusimicrobiota bacterium]
MYNKELIIEIFKNIDWALEQIDKRFQGVRSCVDFIKDDSGLEKMDSICMQLINIGEVTKQVDKLTDAKFLVNYPGIDWKKIKGMRDIIAHQYFDIDAETIFIVCSEHLPELKKVIQKILSDINHEK